MADNGRADARPAGRSGLFGPFLLAYLIGAGLLVALLHFANPWNVAAGTRFLDLLLDGGIIPLTDADLGFGLGVPNTELFVASQDPVAWTMVLVAGALFLLMALLKAYQFHRFARAAGVDAGFGQHGRAYLYGHGLSRLLPFNTGFVAQAEMLEAQGAKPASARGVVLLSRGFLVVEVLLFVLVGMALFGPIAALQLLAWPLVILGVAAFLTGARELGGARARARRTLGTGAALGRSLVRRPALLAELTVLSVGAFLLVDAAAYATSQAFTSENVLLNVEPSLILMGVLGGYVARLIPIAPGGIGQFEWGFAAVLYMGEVGFPEAAIVAVLVTAIRYAAGGILFGLLLLTTRSQTSVRQVLASYAGARTAQGVAR